MVANIVIPQDEIEVFCQRWKVSELALFGSVLRDDFRPDSDIDVLVEFEAGHVPGLIRMGGLEIEMSSIVGRKVDLRTPAELSRYFRQEVMDGAEPIYERA